MPSSKKTAKSRKAPASSGKRGTGGTRAKTARSTARAGSASGGAKKSTAKSGAAKTPTLKTPALEATTSKSAASRGAAGPRAARVRTAAKSSVAKNSAAKAGVSKAGAAKARASAARTSAAKTSAVKTSAVKTSAVEANKKKAAASRGAAKPTTTHRAKRTSAPRAIAKPASADTVRKQASTAAKIGATGETSRKKMTAQDGATTPTIENPVVATTPAVPVAPSATVANATPPKAQSVTTPSTPASSESIPVAKTTPGKAVNAKSPPAPKAAAPTPVSAPALPPKAIVAARAASAAAKPAPAVKSKTPAHKLGFKTNEFIVYPAHGVGQIVAIEVQEVAGFSLELFVVSFIKDKMILKVPTSKVAAVGMRKLAETEVVDKALATLTGRARVKRTMWSRRAQEYEAKINSGDLVTIAEVVRDLYRSDTQPEQSYSERQLYEAALDRMAREVAAVRKLIDSESLKLIESFLLKGPRRGQKTDADAGDDSGDDDDVDRAA